MPHVQNLPELVDAESASENGIAFYAPGELAHAFILQTVIFLSVFKFKLQLTELVFFTQYYSFVLRIKKKKSVQ